MDTDQLDNLDARADNSRPITMAELLAETERLSIENRRMHELLDRKWDAGRSKRPCAGCGAFAPAFALWEDVCGHCWYRRAKGLEKPQ